MIKYILSFLLLGIYFNGFAQRKNVPPYERFKKSTVIGFGIGSSQYLGDIHTINNIYSYTTTIRWNGSLSLTRHLSPLLSVRLNTAWIRVSGDDFTTTKKLVNGTSNKYDFSFLRNIGFRNDIKEVSLLAMINLKNSFYSLQDYKRPIFTPYLLIGIGGFLHKPKSREKYNIANQKLSQWEPINIAGTPPIINLNVPLGIGFRRKISNKLDIAAELSYRILFTDLIDDIKDEPYPNLTGTFANRSQERYNALTGEDRSALYNVVAARQALSSFSGTSSTLPPNIGFPNLIPKRGEAGNDSFFTTSIQLRYYIEKKIVCPKIK